MPRPENPLDPHAGPLADFAAGLRRLRKHAGLTYRELAQQAHTSASALSQAANGQKLPTWEVTAAFVRACGGDLNEWQTRWEEVAGQTDEIRRAPRPIPSAPPVQAMDTAGRDSSAEDAPPLGSMVSVGDFHAALRSLRQRAGNPSLRDLEAAAQRHGHALRRSTLSDALGRSERLPPLEFVDAFLAACEVAGPELDDWHVAWARVAYHAQRQSEPEDPRWSGTCPYQGLGSFGPEHAALFFGREQATAELVTRVAQTVDGTGMLVVTGPSGAGKSSLLRAGLLPALAKGALGPGSQHWPHLVMAPGAAPLQQLACALAALAGADESEVLGQLTQPDRARLIAQQVLEVHAEAPGTAPALRPHRLVVVVDQFEEVFSSCPDRVQREAFISALAAMTGDSNTPAPAVVILGVRGDFFGHCASHAALARVLQTGTFVVGPLTESELRSTITGPAATAGLLIEEGLVDNILADLRSTETSSGFEPAVLPLLSHALLQTWQHREDGRLTHRAYAAIGGIARSIAASAEAAYEKLTPSQQNAAMTILRRMVTIPREGAITRRRTHLSELDSGQRAEDVSAALAALTDCRLVSVSNESAEISHETLLRSWPRLNAWLESSRVQIGLLAHLAEAAQEWASNGEEPAFLYRGVRLDAVVDGLDWTLLSATERSFLNASLAHTARDQRVARRRVRTTTAMMTALVVLLVISSWTTYVALSSRDTAEAQRKYAVSHQIVTESQTVSGNPTLAGLLSVAGWRIAQTTEARNSMIAAATERGGVIDASVFTADADTAAIALSPDGHTLATAGKDKEIRLWDITQPKHPRAQPPLSAPDRVQQMTFSPDGRTLVVATDRIITVIDVAATKVQRSVGLASLSLQDMAFSPDGRLLAVTDDKYMWILDMSRSSPHILSRVAVSNEGAKITALVFSPSGRTLATATSHHTVQLWELSEQQPRPRKAALLTGHAAAVNSLAFSPNGRTLASASSDNTIRLWDISDLAEPRAQAVLAGHTGPVQGVAFSGDGQTLATAASDNTLRLWDTTTLRQTRTLIASTDGISRVVFSPDNHGLLAIGQDGKVQQWTIPAQAHPRALAAAICAQAGRDLTKTEWDHYVKYVPYQKICSAF
ncbi:helix-turn-helix domain-containing protein [Streptomyces sp. NPDC101151]|uniref:nSTAND1 domain-containing NTPase n=1 Tax=Streptomyces sp. NPDC101151 TaxID=3366115 RepID=UPI00380485B8